MEGEGNEAFFSGPEHFGDSGGEKAHGVFQVPGGVENPLGRSGGAGGVPGDYPLDFPLAEQQKFPRGLGQHIRGSEGQVFQFVQGGKLPGKIPIGPRPGGDPGEGFVEPAKLQLLQNFPVQLRQSFHPADPIIQFCLVHDFRYNARPFRSVRL